MFVMMPQLYMIVTNTVQKEYDRTRFEKLLDSSRVDQSTMICVVFVWLTWMFSFSCRNGARKQKESSRRCQAYSYWHALMHYHGLLNVTTDTILYKRNGKGTMVGIKGFIHRTLLLLLLHSYKTNTKQYMTCTNPVGNTNTITGRSVF